MIDSGQKTSLLIPSQLPEFIRDEPSYDNFVLFLQAYYEWLEQNDNITDRSKNLLNYKDIDNTTSEFLDYFYNDFLSYFPNEILGDKQKVIKLARELYQSKGTPASYQFLFRVLYNTDVDFFYTKDAVLKASSGKWYVAKSLKLSSDDPNFLVTNNLRIFGETTKSIATIENALFSGAKIEVFISNIERLFQSGETVRVVDSNNQDVYFLNNKIIPSNTPELLQQAINLGAEILTAKIVGQISQIKINSKYRGLKYKPGDPIIVHGGLNSPQGHGASAEVGSTTKGSITRIKVESGGYGYTSYTDVINPDLIPSNFTQISITNASGAAAHVSGLDSANTANATFIPKDYLGQKKDVLIGSSNYFFPGRYYITVAPEKVYTTGEKIFQGISVTSNTFSANVVSFDSPNNILTVANTTGIAANTYTIRGNTSNTIRTLNSYTGAGAGKYYFFISDGEYSVGETVYEGANVQNPTFFGTIDINDKSNNILKLTNVYGTATTNANLIGITTSTSRNVISYDNTTNANTTFASTLTFASFPTYPITSVIVDNGGGGIETTPEVTAHSYYSVVQSGISWNSTTSYSIGDTIIYGGISYVATKNNLNILPTTVGSSSSWSIITPDLANLGILAPIKIVTGGNGYQVNDKINLIGGSGYGVAANVLSVNATGSIISVGYVYPNASVRQYPLGGMGFDVGLPALTITSANTLASNAVLSVLGTLGTGATFTPDLDRVGSITTINLIDPGEDYIAAPEVSFKIQDIVVTDTNITNLPASGDIIYQGSDANNALYQAIVDSISLLIPYNDPTQSLYNLRVYNYSSLPNYNLPLKIDSKSISIKLTNSYTAFAPDSRYDATGVITYGDGLAQGTASFLNGLVLSSGQYLDTTGQPSSFDILQSTNYNNFTYQITLEKEIEKYRKVLLDLLHPTGMKVIGRYALKANGTMNTSFDTIMESGHYLSHYTNNTQSYVTMTSDWTNQSNNIVNFYNLDGPSPGSANLQNFIVPGSSITISLNNGFEVHSEVANVNIGTSNNVVLTNNVWLTFANVAQVTANSGSSVINISSLTGSYDMVNNGGDSYSNTNNHLEDIVFAGDKVLVANNTERVVLSVNYPLGIITLTSALSANVNSLMSVKRTVSTITTSGVAAGTVQIDDFVDVPSYPALVTEDYRLILTQDGRSITTG